MRLSSQSPSALLNRTTCSTVVAVGETVAPVLAAGAKLANGGAGSPLADQTISALDVRGDFRF
jgi:hypothetical protein